MIDFDKDVMPLKNKFYRLALRLLHNDAEAQDITQETLIRLWTRCSNLASVADAENLGLTISYNLSRDALSRAGRNYEPLDNIDENLVPNNSQDIMDRLVAADRRTFIKKIINNLPTKQKTLVQLRDIEGKSYREIADIMQISEEDVKITLYRARQSLKEICKKSDAYGL